MRIITKKVENKFRKTKPREVILSVLGDSKRYLTAKQVYDVAKGVYPGIGFSSVYRTLKLFKNQGIVEVINVRGMESRFQLKTKRHACSRIRLICMGCEQIGDLPERNDTFDKRIKGFKKILKDGYGFDASVFDIRIFGKYNQQDKEVIYMPFGDGTGPLGQGPMTGRRGGGRGRGTGRGMGRRVGTGINRGTMPVAPIDNTALAKEEEDLVNKVYNLLPKINCGACGYPTCMDCARAIVKGQVPYNACRVLKPEQQEKIKEVLQGRR